MRLVDAEGKDIPISAVSVTTGKMLVVMPVSDDYYIREPIAEKIALAFDKRGVSVIVLPVRVAFAAIDL